ncbi:MAG: inosose dehydratase, partial [Solirubrobacteraceae bacterium]|nr:inosose dehydratase [Solirubrobacteraceae bacterium]
MRLGHQTNAWGGVVGHPAGVTSVKDLFYLTPGDTLAAFGEAAAAGYAGVEVFDGDLAEHAGDLGRVRRALDEHRLALIGVYSGANLVFEDILPEELWRVGRACEWAAELGAEHLVLGGGAQRVRPPTDADYDRMAASIDEVVRLAERHGLVASFHPHMGTTVQSPEQIERLLSRTGVNLCPDTGHLQAGGGDPVELVHTYRDRIAYVHIKDID